MTIERRVLPKVQPKVAPKVLPKVQPKGMREPRSTKKPTRSDAPKSVREQVKDRARLCCERCGIWSPPPVGEVHHRRNRSQGVDNSLPNLLLLCRDCHAWVGARPKDAHEEGFHLEHGQIPAKTELLYGGPYVQEYGHRLALLRDDGEVTLLGDKTLKDAIGDDPEMLS